jgi:acetyl esterase/lipase
MHRRPSYRRDIELRPSLRSRAYSAALRLMLRTRITPDTDIVALRRQFAKLDARHVSLDRSVERTPVQCDGVAAEWLAVPESRPERVLLYLRGGSFAFRFANAHAALIARLCRALHARALVPDYRLAPEHPFPAAPDDCYAAYRYLLREGVAPSDIVVAGDSAGGNLALVTLQRAREAGEPMPACAVLLSPALDCTMQSPSMAHFDGVDPLLRLSALLVLRGHYVPSPDLYMHPEVSPLFGDFAGLPPLFFQTGSTEMLRDEAVRAAAKAHEAGVDVELELWPGAPHGFQIAEFLPESSIALAHITRFVRMRTRWPDLAA